MRYLGIKCLNPDAAKANVEDDKIIWAAHAARYSHVVGKYLNKSLKKIQYGLQMSANRRVARELAHLGFHQQKEYNQILDQLNDKTNAEYHSRY